MAYAKKYEIQFYTAENKLCYVEFFIDGYSGSVTQLTPASSPFVLKEYNTDDDIFKPVRGQEASISFLSSDLTYSVSIDDFLSNSDTYCYIRFKYDSSSLIYWTGYLLQDDFQESWQNTKHIITLRANEGLGLLKNELLSDDGSELIGYFDISDLLTYCIQNSLPEWGRFNVINNLYHSSMDDTLPQPSIKQCRVDARTFSVGDGEYEDKYTVLEKINKAFNQTIFQYKGRWHIVRIEEFYTSFSNNLRQKEFYTLGFPDQWTTTNLRYDLEVGVNETIKPIEPSMLRMVNRITKEDKINFTYDYPSELIYNQNFQRGSLLTSGSGYKTYSVTGWNCYKGYKETPIASTADHYRKDVIDAYGRVTDSYFFLNAESYSPPTLGTNWLQSTDLRVKKGDVIDLTFLYKPAESSWVGSGLVKVNVMQILYKKDASPQIRLSLADDGTWKSMPSPGTWDASPVWLQTYLTISKGNNTPDESGFFEKSVLSKPITDDGIIRILLIPNGLSPAFSGNGLWSQLKLRLQNSLGGLNTSTIYGEYEKYNKTENVKSNYEDEIYIDDTPNINLIGTIFETDNFTPTTPTWYRYRFPDESYGFKNQNLIAHYQNTRFPRTKIDANFYGLSQGSSIVGLINTIKFVDDDPNKVYAIANMKEIDFAAETWSATLVEVFDETKDSLVGVNATLETGLQSGKAYLPLDMVDTSNFILLTNDKIKYIGTESIIVDIVGTIVGSVTSATVPQDFIISITKNTSTFLDSETYEVAVNPTAINFTLNGNNVTLNTNDTIEFKNDALTPPITVTSGGITITAIAYSYPGYEKKYIYK
jgi:hypothetical protein